MEKTKGSGVIYNDDLVTEGGEGMWQTVNNEQGGKILSLFRFASSFSLLCQSTTNAKSDKITGLDYRKADAVLGPPCSS